MTTASSIETLASFLIKTTEIGNQWRQIRSTRRQL